VLAQIEREIDALTVRARRFKSEVDDRMKEVIAVEDENRDQVRDRSLLDYAALSKVVGTLLQIGDGSTRLSREDPAIIAVLEEAAGHFHALREISRENASQMGTAASHYMSLGDQAAVSVGDLQSYVDSLNNDVPYIWDVMKSHKTTVEKKQVRRAELQNQYDSAVDS
jgi:hypothetical protein